MVSQGKLKKSQGKVRELCVKNLSDTLCIVIIDVVLIQMSKSKVKV